MAEIIGSFDPISFGEERHFRVQTVKSGQVAVVGIKCFVRPPNPPEYRDCPECGEISSLRDGEFFHVEASNETFAGNPGGLEIVVEEAGVETNVYHIMTKEDKGFGSLTMTA